MTRLVAPKTEFCFQCLFAQEETKDILQQLLTTALLAQATGLAAAEIERLA